MRIHRFPEYRKPALIQFFNGSRVWKTAAGIDTTELKIWGPILSFAIPMILSLGPGNTILAAAGGKFGVRGTRLVWLGFESGNFYGAWSTTSA